MILQVSDPKYLEIFAAVYNSANTLFGENERGAATADTFALQLETDKLLADTDGGAE